MSKEEHYNRLQQENALRMFRRDILLTEMVTVCLSDQVENHNHGIYCAFIPTELISKSLGSSNWDLSHGGGIPGATCYHENGCDKVEYHRFGNNKGIEPLIIDRYFHGIRQSYREISEEFRLFHDLYHDARTNHYFKIDSAGNEQLVAVVTEQTVEIRLKELRQFLAVKEMYLAIQFDFREHAPFKLEELGLKRGGCEFRDDVAVWTLSFGDMGFGTYRAFSRLLGKRIIKPLPKEKSGFWGFASEEQKKCVDFIIGVDQDGNEILNTSNPNALADYFGGNVGEPHYLTPVHFRKQVLDKYYQLPGKYKVEDSYFSCGSLWGMPMDNHLDDRVCAWLGDLGRDLPYEEQLHWKSYNINPQGTVSKTFFRQQILGQFTESSRPEHNFKSRYDHLEKLCGQNLGWQMLKPLQEADRHHLDCLRVPASDEQREFDDLVLSLTKILVDSINEKELGRFIPTEEKAGLKGSISILEKALSIRGAEQLTEHITFLRSLQELRSTGVAHRKGSNYRKIASELGIVDQTLPFTFTRILGKSVELLDYFIENVSSGIFGDRPARS